MWQGPNWGSLARAASMVRTVWKVLSHGGGRCLMNVTTEKMQQLLWGHHDPLRQMGEGEVPWLLPSSHAPVFHNLPLAEPTWRPTDKRQRQCSTLVGRTEQEKDRVWAWASNMQKTACLHVKGWGCIEYNKITVNNLWWSQRERSISTQVRVQLIKTHREQCLQMNEGWFGNKESRFDYKYSCH